MTSTATATRTTTRTTTAAPPTTETPTARGVADATFGWSMNDEAGAGAYFGGCNFLSAGVAGDTGRSRVWTQRDGLYHSRSGNTTIIAPTSDGGSTRPTWRTKCLDASGNPVSAGRPDQTTGNRVRITGGTGWVDPSEGTAQIAWSGSWTVVFYGGMTYWSISDPVLAVAADGSGTVTATASGYGADMDDTNRWEPLDPATITLANLHDVRLGANGFTARPDYLGVRVRAAAAGSSTPQVQRTTDNHAYWGSFPQSFIDYQVLTGQQSYWYTSGGARDAAKPATPIRVRYRLGPPIDEPADVPTGALPGPPTRPATTTTIRTRADTSTPGAHRTRTSAHTAGAAAPDGPFTVDDATLRWGINSESGNAAFAPGTVNMLSAGRSQLGGPARTVTADLAGDPSIWSAETGNVRIFKRQPDGSYAPSTFAGLFTDVDGNDLGAPNEGRFSGHQVVIDRGSGTIDPVANTAEISWKGSFTVLYYSGMTYFFVTDPVLTVRADGSAALTAVAGGFTADMKDLTRWDPLPDTEVTLATMSGVSLDSADGFTVTPDYIGVEYQPPPHAGIPEQRRDGEAFGSFPSSFVDFQVRTGQAAYWYSSGGSTDAYKLPLPLTVAYQPDSDLAAGGTDTAQRQDDTSLRRSTAGARAVTNAVNPPPPQRVAARNGITATAPAVPSTPHRPRTVPADGTVAAPPAAGAPGAPGDSDPLLLAGGVPPAQLGARPEPAVLPAAVQTHPASWLPWAAGAMLLFLAAALLWSPAIARNVRGRSRNGGG